MVHRTASRRLGRRDGRWRLWAAATLLVSMATEGALGVVAARLAGAASVVTVSPSTTPAFAGDAPDPDIVLDGGTYYAFTTGTVLGNHLQALVDTSGNPAAGYRSYTGTGFGSTALADPPAWEQPTTQTSPGVFFWGGHWLMYYDAAQTGHAGDTGFDCLSVAAAATLTPSDPQFTDTSTAPLLCQPSLGGSIDPSPFVDPATGRAYLVWKSNDGGSSQPARIWSAPLSADGLSLAGQPVQLLTNDTVDFPWETTVEDPDMVDIGGTYYLFFSGGIYTTAGYAQGYAVCSGPTGPCTQSDPNPVLTSYGSVLGPGGGSLFPDASGNWLLAYQGWQGGTSGCTSYGCGATRQMFVAPVAVTPATSSCNALAQPAPHRVAGADGGTFNDGNLPFCSPGSGTPLDAPVVGMAATPDGQGYWLVTSKGQVQAHGDAQGYGTLPTQGVNVDNVVGIAPSEAATGTVDGYWLDASDGGIFSFGTAHFYGSMGGKPLNQPMVSMAPTPDGLGYWTVAADGGVFSFGDAQFHGSMGGHPLNEPVVGMAVDRATGGYWLVASDGGVFSFDAPFDGSMGGDSLNAPIEEMEAAPTGSGYRLVAEDGGVFDFNLPFEGSLGSSPPSDGITAMAASGRTGYWLVEPDGTVHDFGSAPNV